MLAGRDLPGLTAVEQRVESATGNTNLAPMELDLAALASVRAFAAEFRTRDLPGLTTIICNAGISKPTVGERSADGYEATVAVNHLGHFLLVNLLLDCLQPPRYVQAEWLAYPERDTGLPRDDGAAGGQAYASSKLCNVLCAYELARRLEASGHGTPNRPMTVNAFDPGLMAVGRTTTQSGNDLAYLATAPELAAVTGRYFSGRAMVPS